MKKNRILALSGLAGSGKDTAAGMIPNARRLAFADPLKQFCKDVFDFTDDQIYGPSESRNAPDSRYGGLTPRFALQTLGTEWGRKCYENVWVDYGIRRAQRVLEHDPMRTVVFTDCRFVNEAKAVREAGGQVWRIHRPGAGLTGGTGTHPSEVEQCSDDFSEYVSATLYNTGTIEDLEHSVLNAFELFF